MDVFLIRMFWDLIRSISGLRFGNVRWSKHGETKTFWGPAFLPLLCLLSRAVSWLNEAFALGHINIDKRRAGCVGFGTSGVALWTSFNRSRDGRWCAGVFHENFGAHPSVGLLLEGPSNMVAYSNVEMEGEGRLPVGPRQPLEVLAFLHLRTRWATPPGFLRLTTSSRQSIAVLLPFS